MTTALTPRFADAPVLARWLPDAPPETVAACCEAMHRETRNVRDASMRLAVLIYLLHRDHYPAPEQAAAWVECVAAVGVSKVWAYKCVNGVSFLCAHTRELAPHADGLDVEKLSQMARIPDRFLPLFWDRHGAELGGYSHRQVAYLAAKYKAGKTSADAADTAQCAVCGEDFVPDTDGPDTCRDCRRKRKKRPARSLFDRLRSYDPGELDPMDEYAYAFLRLDRMLDAMAALPPGQPLSEAAMQRIRGGIAAALHKLEAELGRLYAMPEQPTADVGG